MSDSDILSEYFKKSSTDNFFDQISCETSNSYDSVNNEASRRSCAWIPSELTRKLLIQVATKVNSPIHVSEDIIRLTKPKLVLQASSLEDHVAKYIQKEDRVPGLTMKDVTLDDRGLRELIQAESYLAAIELTEHLLAVYKVDSGKHTLTSVQLWFTRIALLVKSNFFQEAYEESKPWWNFDTPDLYLQYYPTLYGGRIGTMVPFSFRLLVAELPQYIKSTPDIDTMSVTLDRLFSIMTVIKKIITNLNNNLSEDGSMLELTEQDRTESKTLWIQRETRVKHSVVNCALHFKNYMLAYQMMKQLLEQPRQILTEKEKVVLHSSIGRILIQAGDTLNARQYFTTSQKLLETLHQADELIVLLKLQQQIDQGLLLVAENNIKEASILFNTILQNMKNKLSNSNYENIYLVVLNNKAICDFYMGDVKKSINLVEQGLKYKQSLNRYLLDNLCTYYNVHGVDNQLNKSKIIETINERKVFVNSDCLAFSKV